MCIRDRNHGYQGVLLDIGMTSGAIQIYGRLEADKQKVDWLNYAYCYNNRAYHKGITLSNAEGGERDLARAYEIVSGMPERDAKVLSAMGTFSKMCIRDRRCAAQQHFEKVTDDILDEAFASFDDGQTEALCSEEELKRIARHEAGHAFICWQNQHTPAYLTVMGNKSFGGYMLQENERRAYNPVSYTHLYLLPIQSVELHVYRHGVGILFIQMSNNDYPSLQDIKKINDYGRRISMPFIPDTLEKDMLCADEIGIVGPKMCIRDSYGMCGKILCPGKIR